MNCTYLFPGLNHVVIGILKCPTSVVSYRRREAWLRETSRYEAWSRRMVNLNCCGMCSSSNCALGSTLNTSQGSHSDKLIIQHVENLSISCLSCGRSNGGVFWQVHQLWLAEAFLTEAPHLRVIQSFTSLPLYVHICI
jgi:hypothetical protein